MAKQTFFSNDDIGAIQKIVTDLIANFSIEGIVTSVNNDRLTAQVALSGSNKSQTAVILKGLQLSQGDTVMCFRSTRTGRWIVFGAYVNQTVPGATPTATSPKVLAPVGLTVTPSIGMVIASWTVGTDSTGLFEVEVANDTGETAKVMYIIAASVLPVATVIQKYVRVRTIDIDFNRSGWSAWANATPYTMLPLEFGGTEADLSATGPGAIIQATSGAALSVLKHKLNATVAPAVTDDGAHGYAIGSQWIDVTAKKEYVLVDISTGAAVWKETTTAGGGTVSSVGLTTDASYLTIGGSPVTGSSVLTANKTTGLTANRFVATPDGSVGVADLRAIAKDDLTAALTTPPDIGGATPGAVTATNFKGNTVLIGSSLNAAAIVEFDSTTKGLLIPRMTTTQRNAISSPPDGLLIYNTTSHHFSVYENSSWVEMGTGGGGGSSPLTTKGDLWGYDSADARIPVGTDGQVLEANSFEALGVKWVDPNGGGIGSIRAKVRKTTSQSISSGSWQIAEWNETVYDNTGSITLGSGAKFTAPRAGTYRVSSSILSGTDSVYVQLAIFKNGVIYQQLDYSGYSNPSSRSFPHGSSTLFLATGDYIDIRVDPSGSSSIIADSPPEGYNVFEVESIDLVPSIGNSVVARYHASGGQTLTGSTQTILDCSVKDVDTDNAVTTGASWKFTAPIKGNYEVSAIIGFAGADSDSEMNLFKNGSRYAELAGRIPSFSSFTSGGGATIVPLNAGDYIDIRIYVSSTVTIYGSANAHISVHQVDISAVVPLPRRATMWHDEATITVGNALSPEQNDSPLYNFYALQRTSANGDTFTNSFFLASGTYTLSVLGQTASGNGTIDLYIDDVLVASGFDWYSGSTVWNVKKTATVTVIGDGYHVFKGVTNGHNGGSSGYEVVLTKYWLKPSAD